MCHVIVAGYNFIQRVARDETVAWDGELVKEYLTICGPRVTCRERERQRKRMAERVYDESEATKCHRSLGQQNADFIIIVYDDFPPWTTHTAHTHTHHILLYLS